MPRRILPLIAVIALGLAVLAGVAWKSGLVSEPASAGPGGPFQLVDQTGKPQTERLLKGKWTVVFFGYTYCPDVCPTTLAALGQAQSILGPKAKDLQVVFVSVDPERDKVQQMAAYLNNDSFPKGTIGLTGTPEQVAAAAKAYRVYYAKDGEGSAYQVNHSSAAYLMDPKGRFARVLAFGIGPDEIARQISDAMAG